MNKIVIMQVPEGELSHAATGFIKEANSFSSRITISQNGKTVNAKSLLGFLSLNPAPGSELELSAEGDDAEQALQALSELLERS